MVQSNYSDALQGTGLTSFDQHDRDRYALIVAPESDRDRFPLSLFQSLNLEPLYASKVKDARNLVKERPFDIALIRLQPGSDASLSLFDLAAKHCPDCPMIVIAENQQINQAAEAMHLGASDCIFIPFTPERLKQIIMGTLDQRSTLSESRLVDSGYPAESTAAAPLDDGSNASNPAASGSPSNIDALYDAHGMILSDLSVKPVLNTLNAVAPSDAPVFIRGETGTGKELLANAIHATSLRADKPIVFVDCARLDADRLLAELFGHRKGASAGADEDRIGAAELADGGTLFLDEITHADPAAQKLLLNFVETGEIHPLGSNHLIKVDVRIICSTIYDPMEEIRNGRLRSDLFYRLHVVPIELPALRDRGSDILKIAQTKLQELSRTEGRRFTQFSPTVEEKLLSYPWPGNIRQLINTIWSIVLHHDGDEVTLNMLPDHLLVETVVQALEHAQNQGPTVKSLLGRPLSQIERIIIEATIDAEDGSVPRAAEVLQVSPSTLYRKRESWQQD